jgi:hypothetical protein
MLSEPTADDVMVVCSEIPDVGLEVSRAVSRALSTLEGSLQCQGVGLSCPTPMEVIGELSALEVAAVESPTPEGVAGSDPALVGSASCNLAPEGVQVSSPSHTSMDVHLARLHLDPMGRRRCMLPWL